MSIEAYAAERAGEPLTRWLECGNCYGEGCWSCGSSGQVENPAWREAYDDYMADEGDRRRDDRLTHGGDE